MKRSNSLVAAAFVLAALLLPGMAQDTRQFDHITAQDRQNEAAPTASASAGSDAASDTPARQPPMITHNPDGTFTIQWAPTKEQEAESPKAKQGLIIPPQVVVPEIPAVERRN